MRFLLIEAYAKLVECARNTQEVSTDIYAPETRILTKWLFGAYKKHFLEKNNKLLDKLYINIDDVYAWNLLIINFSLVTISLAA